MKRLITQPEQQIIGVLKGWDRVRFRGTLRILSCVKGVLAWMLEQKVLFQEFAGFSKGLTDRWKRSVEGVASAAREDRAGSGVGAEWCGAVSVVRHSASPGEAAHRSGVAAAEVSAWVLVLHPSGVGLCHIRIQSWLPFTVPVCVNGREWLCRELAEAGIGFRRRDHCLIQVDDQAVAQRLLDAQPWHDGSAGLNA